MSRRFGAFRTLLPVLVLALCTGLPPAAHAWPYDGYAETGIRRLEEVRLVLAGETRGDPVAVGARWPTADVDLRLTACPDLVLPTPDAALTRTLRGLLGGQDNDYALALLDLSDPRAPVYAEWRGDHRQNVGSVGKLLVALGLFQALADTWPDDTLARGRVLHDALLVADDFSQTDHHTIRLFDPVSRTLVRRPMAIGDRGNLWEYLDWMLSVSSNSAAAMVQRDAMMLRALGRDYPPAPGGVDPFFDALGPQGRTQLFQQTFWAPVTGNGLDLRDIRQGSFLTAGGKKRVNGGGDSYATVRSLVQFMLLMEQGRLVDAWSSRQLKRLLYLTERRIRYASAPALAEAAVYFKSGSLYACKPEEGFTCGRYRGNVRNYMNSVAIVEQDVGGRRIHYAVALISNVLRVNSAEAHQALGADIHALMLARHDVAPATD